MTVEKKTPRRRAIGTMERMVSIDTANPLRSILFDINYQLQKVLGVNTHTLAFQCAVNGVVYGVTVIRENNRLTCQLLSFIDNQEAQIFWPSIEHVLTGIYATTNLREDFDFRAFSTEIETLFGSIPSVVRRRLASVLGPEDGGPSTLADQIREAQELAAEFAGEDLAEPLHVSLGVSFPPDPILPVGEASSSVKAAPVRRKSVIYSAEKAAVPVVAGIRAKVHSVFIGKKEEKKTVMLDGSAVRVIEYLLRPDIRSTLASRNPREPMRRQFLQGGWHVLYVQYTAAGLWVYAGPEGLQNRNRIFIPFQLEGTHVRIPPDAPWQLIANMLGQ